MAATASAKRDRLKLIIGRRLSARLRMGKWLTFLLAIELVVLVAAGSMALHEFRYNARIYPGVSVSGIPLAGLTLDQATEAIRDSLTPAASSAITLRFDGRIWLLTPAELGVTVDSRATAAFAYRLGRRGLVSGASDSLGTLWSGLGTDLLAQWVMRRDGAAVDPIFRFDQNRLAFALKRIVQEVDLPPREGQLIISGTAASGMPGRAGRLMDVDTTRAAIVELLLAGKGGTVNVPVEVRQPAVLSVDAAVAQATVLLGRSFTLTAEGAAGRQQFAVDPATLRQWLNFTPKPAPGGSIGLAVQIDKDQVTTFVQRIAEQVNRLASDARLDFDPKTGQVIILQPSQPGQQLDVATAVVSIQAAIIDGVPLAEASAASHAMTAAQEIVLPVVSVAPRVDSTRIAEMGIIEQISEGTTYFKGSSPERAHNIVLSAGKLLGAVIPPGEEFSFNAIVGDVSAENGFVDSLIIVGDRTEVGVGGGVCQVSTTVFRAAFWAGFPITERIPHSYWVNWYAEPGLDATIYTPDVDFRFRNDTAHYVLIQPEVDTVAGRITLHFYGTRPDRTVEMAKPVLNNLRDAPQPLYREDAALKAGTIKQVDWAKRGMDVTVERITTYGDGRIQRDEFFSRYQPWQAVYRYGPGTKLPAGAVTP